MSYMGYSESLTDSSIPDIQFSTPDETWDFEDEFVAHKMDGPLRVEDALGNDVVEVQWQSAMVGDDQPRAFGRQVLQAAELIALKWMGND